VQGKDQVASKIATGDTNITDHADKPPSRNEDPVNMAPDFLKLKEERLVILDMAKLVRVLVVPLEVPIRRRGHDKMDRGIVKE